MIGDGSKRRLSQSTVKLLDYNDLLEKESSIICLNEAFLVKKLRELEAIGASRDKLYWLTLARVTELAILCAGNYADNCEFRAAGDLLVNPRLTIVHTRRCKEGIIKRRHLKLTEQFGNLGGTKEEIVELVKREAVIEIEEDPLLPDLYKQMQDSGFLAQNYLNSVNSRMKQIADVITFLLSYNVFSGVDLYNKLKSANQSEREFIESKLCKFNKKIFIELGNDIRRLAINSSFVSNFLERI